MGSWHSTLAHEDASMSFSSRQHQTEIHQTPPKRMFVRNPLLDPRSPLAATATFQRTPIVVAAKYSMEWDAFDPRSPTAQRTPFADWQGNKDAGLRLLDPRSPAPAGEGTFHRTPMAVFARCVIHEEPEMHAESPKETTGLLAPNLFQSVEQALVEETQADNVFESDADVAKEVTFGPTSFQQEDVALTHTAERLESSSTARLFSQSSVDAIEPEPEASERVAPLTLNLSDNVTEDVDTDLHKEMQTSPRVAELGFLQGFEQLTETVARPETPIPDCQENAPIVQAMLVETQRSESSAMPMDTPTLVRKTKFAVKAFDTTKVSETRSPFSQITNSPRRAAGMMKEKDSHQPEQRDMLFSPSKIRSSKQQGTPNRASIRA